MLLFFLWFLAGIGLSGFYTHGGAGFKTLYIIMFPVHYVIGLYVVAASRLLSKISRKTWVTLGWILLVLILFTFLTTR